MSSTKLILTLLIVLLLVPSVQAVDFTEDFESYSIIGPGGETKPDQEWYSYTEFQDIGLITAEPPIPQGAQALRITSNATATPSDNRVRFDIQPAQLSSLEFQVIAENGTQQFISIESGAPARRIVQFFIFCTAYCEFKVRSELADATGQTLINSTMNQTEFQVRVDFLWTFTEFCLTVNGVDDGCFPMIDLPRDVGRLEIVQYRGDVPLLVTFDNWTIRDALNFTQAVQSDIVGGLKNHLDVLNIRSSGSLFIYGILLFIVLFLAVALPAYRFAKSNSITPGLSFYGALLVLWLIHIEIWPQWIGISMIIIVAALAGLAVRTVALGIRDASSGAGLVAGSLGYFIIASTLLGFSGYATDTIQTPIGSPQIQEDSGNATTETQSFVGAVAECVITGGVFTFGLTGDCSRETVSKTWVKLTDAASQIFGWIQTGMDFLFQLLTFRLPIPIIFNMIIVLPPAAALATFALQTIRGTG